MKAEAKQQHLVSEVSVLAAYKNNGTDAVKLSSVDNEQLLWIFCHMAEAK
jgi:hypothetical protein